MRTIFWTTLLTLTLALASADPAACLRAYYDHISHKELLEAYAMRSPEARQKLSQEAFMKLWLNNVELRADKFSIEDQSAERATVTGRVSAVDFDPSTGARERGVYSIRSNLSFQDNRWWVDSVDVVKLSSTPVKGLELLSGEKVVKKAPPLPQDIPVYAGFTMSEPVVIETEGLPHPVNTVRSLNRVKGLAPIKVAEFYQRKFKGWSTLGPAGGSGSLSITFTRGRRKVTIHCYGGIFNGTDVVADPRGTRLEIEY